MNIKKLLQDDDAVSPVIGVILMVAITVILAAVIASFVLGLGDQNNPAPTADFDFDFDNSNDQVTVTHNDGDEIAAANLFIRGEQIDASSTFGSSADQTWSNAGGVDPAAAGQSITIDLSSPSDEYVIRMVWEDPDSDQTSTLSTDEGPNA